MGISTSQFFIQTTNSSNIIIQEKSPYSSQKTLRHYINTGTKNNTPMKALISKVRVHEQFIKSNLLTNHKTWTSYFSVYLPSVLYPTPTYWLTQKDIEKVESIALPTLLSRCGFNRNTKRSIIYGPWELGGCTFHNLYVEEGIGAINQVLSYLQTRGQPKLCWKEQQPGSNTHSEQKHPYSIMLTEKFHTLMLLIFHKYSNSCRTSMLNYVSHYMVFFFTM